VNRSRKPWGAEYAHAVNDYMQRWLAEASSEIKAHFKLMRELRLVSPAADGERFLRANVRHRAIESVDHRGKLVKPGIRGAMNERR
jgi:hypothetical protein